MMRIRIFVGTGGVGKTSVAAASALKVALEGRKCLVLTIDPAQRLRTALNLEQGGLEQRVDLAVFSPAGHLWAGLLDAGATLDRAVHLYGEPEQAETVLKHPVYHSLRQSMAGMQELMAIERIDQAIADGFEDLYIDTAPSRHAFEFLDKPEFFAELVSIPLLRFVGKTYKWLEGSMLSSLGRKSVELYARVEELLGANLVRQVLDFYSVFRTIAEGYADRARRTSRLLHDPKITSFTIVTTPLKALRDANYFLGELDKRKFSTGTLIVNRIWPEVASQPAGGDGPRQVGGLVAWYRSVSDAHRRTWDMISAEFASRFPSMLALPELSCDVDGLPALHQIARQLGALDQRGIDD
jgi:anion-transporting  ArsA/GET3 family ATPase